MKKFNKGIILSTSGSLWWGVLGTYYFQFITFVGTLEVVVHRFIWTFLILLITTFYFKKWNLLKNTIYKKKNLPILIITSILIFANSDIDIVAGGKKVSPITPVEANNISFALITSLDGSNLVFFCFIIFLNSKLKKSTLSPVLTL